MLFKYERMKILKLVIFDGSSKRHLSGCFGYFSFNFLWIFACARPYDTTLLPLNTCTQEPFTTSYSINSGGSKFLRKPDKFVCCRPPRKVGAPSYGESWIHHCLSIPYLHKNIAKFSHMSQHLSKINLSSLRIKSKETLSVN